MNPVVAEWGYVPHPGDNYGDELAYKSDTNQDWITLDQIKDFLNHNMEK